MVTVRKLSLVLLLSTLFALPRPFGLPRAEGQDTRTAKLIEGAKKEKEVVVWHIDDIEDELVKAFETKYPFLKVKLWRDRGATMATKALEEAKAGVYSPDLCLFDDINLEWLMDAKLLLNYDWPNTKGWVNQPAHNFYRGIVASPKVPIFNSKVIPKDQWPKGWDDLKDPRWEGKTLASSSGTDTALYTAFTWRKNDQELNWERSFGYWRDVLKATKPRVVRGLSGPIEMLASGAASIMIWNTANGALRAIWKKAPIRMLPIKHLIAGNNSLAVMKNAPHPNASMLFADFLTSKDGLIPYAESRGTAVNAPALEKFARANRDLKEMGLTFEVLPYRFMKDENIEKATGFWLKELGVKAGQ
jgi:iron(III) transport system substrate-binding protein